MTGSFSTAEIIEILATVANLAYIVLLIREKIICWSFGIVGSLLSVYLFMGAKLYSESVLYLFYAVMGVWGWLRWHRQEAENNNPVITWPVARHAKVVPVTALLALGVGFTMVYLTDAERPLFDAFTTVFSFLATYMEIQKVLEAWLFWLVLNLASIWLYYDRNLDIYALLIAVYSVLSVVGFLRWRQSYRQQAAVA